MDLTTIIGIVAGFLLIVNGIMYTATGYQVGNIMNFFDPPSIIIVVGGTIAAVVASYPIKALKRVPKHMKIMMDEKKFDPQVYIDTLVEFAQLARKNGLLALEEKANELEDPFFKQSIMLIVDATDPDRVRTMLTTDLDNLADRHDEGAGMYDKAAGIAPAFGMIGTLVGLVNMLKNMNLDTSGGGGSSNIGSDMSVALITTFYGCIMAHLIFSPIANKLRIRNAEEYLCKQIIIEGVLSIQAGENPKFLKEKLISYLSQKERDVALGLEGGAEGAEGAEGGKGKKKKKEKATKEEKK